MSLAVGWVRLASDLRRSSVAIVSTREEERRRSRCDLHDGIGPALTGVSLGLRTAIRQLGRSPDPEAVAPSRALLERVADEADSVVVEPAHRARPATDGARPARPRRRRGRVRRTFGEDLRFHLALPPAPAELPAAVEVATYRIVTEAVTNVVRHAGAASCWLTIAAGATVEIDVVDDVGIDDDAAGVGLAAMWSGPPVRQPSSSCPTHRRAPTSMSSLPAALP